MKPAIALCSIPLILLTACGGNASSESIPMGSPIPTPNAVPMAPAIPLSSQVTLPVSCDLDLDQLPKEPAESLVEAWNGKPLLLLAQLPQQDIFLYGLHSEDTSQSLVLRFGDELTAYELPWLGPRCIPPELFCGDYDGDEDQEVLILTYTGSGTGVSSWTLTVLEEAGEGWEAVTLPDTSYLESLPPLLACERTGESAVLSLGEISLPLPSFPELMEVGDLLEPVAGTVLHYEVERDSITAVLNVGVFCEGFATPYYCARLEGRLVYDGAGFSLVEPRLFPLE